jgi:hypothetical protein
MRNLEMRLRLDGAEWRVYPLARPSRWLACWDRWRPGGGGLLASCTRELDWSEARRLVGRVAAMDDAAFRSWHAQVLAAGNPAAEGHAGARRGRRGRGRGMSVATGWR